MTPELDQLLDPAVREGIEDRPLDEVRRLRNRCQSAENGLSFVRRLVQGRLDIVHAEIERRREGGSPAKVSDLLEDLPTILADRIRGPGLGRPPQDLAPAEVPDDLLAELDEVAGVDALGELTERDARAVDAQLARLEDLEQRISGLRRQLHEQIDVLQAEITRRYRTGEASVESLLA